MARLVIDPRCLSDSFLESGLGLVPVVLELRFAESFCSLDHGRRCETREIVIARMVAVPERVFIEQQRPRWAFICRALLPVRVAAEALCSSAVTSALSTHGLATDDAVLALACQATETTFSFSLRKQLAAQLPPLLQVVPVRSALVNEALQQLTSGERALLQRKYQQQQTLAEIAKWELRTASAVKRDITNIHTRLVRLIAQALPDATPSVELPELATIIEPVLASEPSSEPLVLESLLLSDTKAQVFYLRFVGLVQELEWKYGLARLPELDPIAPEPTPVRQREWAVTVAFILACLGAVAFGAWAIWK